MFHKQLPRVCIVGGGFAGLEAAKTLADLDAEVILVDQRNHHLFQPLLYQVATAVLSPADIAMPIRHILRNQKNCRVVLAKVEGVDLRRQLLLFRDGGIEYDYLILAAGSSHSYFGHPEWKQFAPGLKTLEDAIALRRQLLLAFEGAEYEGSPATRSAALTFAIVGGGPTGVELAGAIKEIAANALAKDFRNIDTRTTRVILLQGEDRLLPMFPTDLSEKARLELIKMGVEVRLNALVTGISKDGVFVGREFIPVKNVFWAAGVRASPLADSLDVSKDHAGRILVERDLTIPGHRNVFVVGDMAAAPFPDRATTIPAVAPAAIQMGRFAACQVRSRVKRERAPINFRYRDKGQIATIGKARAVAEIWDTHFDGFLAWLLWGAVHVLGLVSFRNRFAVVINWLWNWFSAGKEARLITGSAEISITKPRSVYRMHLWNHQQQNRPDHHDHSHWQ